MVDTVEAVEVESPEAHATLHVGFLMMPEYTLSTFSNAISVLRMANRLSDRDLYHHRHRSKQNHIHRLRFHLLV